MNTEYFVRPYRTGDEKQIVVLLGNIFEGWPRLDLKCTPLEHWGWKYRKNPFGTIYIILGISDGKVVGCLHTMPLHVKIGTSSYPCFIGTDLAVHPDYRGIGISKQMNESIELIEQQKSISFSYWITSNPKIIKSSLERNYEFPFKIINLVRIRDINQQLKAMPMKHSTLKKIGFKAETLFNSLGNKIRRSTKPVEDLEISIIDKFDERIDTFISAVSGHYNFIVHGDKEYLNWRFCDPCGGDYLVSIVEDDQQILGFSVLKINRFLKGYPVGYIVDLLTLHDRVDAAALLFKESIKYFDTNDVNIVNYQLVKDHPYAKMARMYGFLDSRVKLHLFYDPHDVKEIVRVLESSPADRLYISWGNHDTLPVILPEHS